MMNCRTSEYRRADKGLRKVGINDLAAFTGTIRVVVHGTVASSWMMVPTGDSRCNRQGNASQCRLSGNVPLQSICTKWSVSVSSCVGMREKGRVELNVLIRRNDVNAMSQS